jgi:hypothetical protein
MDNAMATPGAIMGSNILERLGPAINLPQAGLYYYIAVNFDHSSLIPLAIS